MELSRQLILFINAWMSQLQVSQIVVWNCDFTDASFEDIAGTMDRITLFNDNSSSEVLEHARAIFSCSKIGNSPKTFGVPVVMPQNHKSEWRELRFDSQIYLFEENLSENTSVSEVYSFNNGATHKTVIGYYNVSSHELIMEVDNYLQRRNLEGVTLRYHYFKLLNLARLIERFQKRDVRL